MRVPTDVSGAPFYLSTTDLIDDLKLRCYFWPIPPELLAHNQAQICLCIRPAIHPAKRRPVSLFTPHAHSGVVSPSTPLCSYKS